jgi:hypothetical protein
MYLIALFLFKQENMLMYVLFAITGDQALEILRRAGEDLAEFGHLLSSIKTAAEESRLKL